MDMTLLAESLSEGWLFWGLILVVAFPFTVILLGELQHYLERKDSEWVFTIRFLQRLIIPQLVLLLITTRILEWPHDDLVVRFIGTLLWSFIIYAVLSVLNRLLFSESESRWKITVPKLLQDVGRFFILAIGIAIVLSEIWGVDLGKMLTAFGFGSIGLGLALQGTVKSVFAGFTLVSSKYINVDDWIEIEGKVGKVISVDTRTVTLISRELDIIVYPSQSLLEKRCINFTTPDRRHVIQAYFHLPFDAEPDKVEQVLIQAALDTTGVIKEPEPVIELIEFKVNGLIYEAKLCIADYEDEGDIKDRFSKNAWYALKRAGISFPIPKQMTFLHRGLSHTGSEDTAKILATFRQNPLFASFEQEALEGLAQQAFFQVYGQGELLHLHNREAGCFYLIIQGQVHLHDNQLDEQAVAEHFSAGDLLAAHPLTGDKHLHDKTARTDSRVRLITFEEKTLDTLVREDESFRHLFQELAAFNL